MSAPTSFAGKECECPNCAETNVIPGEPEEEPNDDHLLKFFCTGCGQKLSCEPELAGHTIDCPICAAAATIPFPDAPAPPAASLPKAPAKLTPPNTPPKPTPTLPHSPKPKPAAKLTPADTKTKTTKAAAEKAAAEKAVSELINVQPLEGGKTIATLFAEHEQIEGQEVSLRAKVMKFSPNILGKNWVTLKDGTGTEPDNKLIVTTAETVSIGDEVVVKGKVKSNIDIGAGYAYKVILEEASFSQ